jgi:hypothetical protein
MGIVARISAVAAARKDLLISRDPPVGHLRIEIEGGGERDFDGGAIGAEDVAECAGRVFLGVEESALFLGIDDPDPFDANGKILLNFWEHADHTVFRRKNFDYQKWGDGRDTGADVVVAPNGDVGDTVARGGDFYRNFRKHADAELGSESVEKAKEIALRVAVLQVVKVTFCDFAVEVFAVGAVEGGAEIFADVHQHFRAHGLIMALV